MSAIVELVLLFYMRIRNWRCKHLEFYENRSCSAICRICHKNLGFIQTHQEKVKLNRE